METYKIKRACPICSQKSSRNILSIPLALPERFTFMKEYNLLNCDVCGFSFADFDGNQQKLDQFYFNDSKYETKNVQAVGGGGVSKEDKIRLSKTFKLIEPYLIKSANILDIGTANGGLLKIFKDNGYHFLTGVEPAKECCSNTVELVGCNCYNNSFLSQEFKQKFDFISLTHVLEHVLDVKSFMDKIYNILNPDGIVYIECPDVNSYNKYIHGPFQEFNTEHINHFGINDYDNLANMNKLEIIKKGTYEISLTPKLNYVSAYCFFKKTPVKNSNIKFKKSNMENINNYIDSSDKMLNKFNDWAINLNQTIFLYGIGQLSYKIIYILEKLRKKIVLIDGDPNKKGKKIGEFEIHDLNYLKEVNEKGILLICSVISAESIEASLINEMGDNLKITHINNCFT